MQCLDLVSSALLAGSTESIAAPSWVRNCSIAAFIGAWQVSPPSVTRLIASFALPRKRNYLPILELLPPPALSERRHRGLARRLVAVRRRAAFMDCLEVNRLEHLGEIEFDSFLATQPERIP